MVEAITIALGGLALTTIGGLGVLVKVLMSRLENELKKTNTEIQANTAITQQTHDASNGRLSDALSQLAAERNLVQGLRYLIRERDDRIAYIVARLPAAADLQHEYSVKLTRRSSEADELAAERHAMGK